MPVAPSMRYLVHELPLPGKLISPVIGREPFSEKRVFKCEQPEVFAGHGWYVVVSKMTKNDALQ